MRSYTATCRYPAQYDIESTHASQRQRNATLIQPGRDTAEALNSIQFRLSPRLLSQAGLNRDAAASVSVAVAPLPSAGAKKKKKEKEAFKKGELVSNTSVSLSSALSCELRNTQDLQKSSGSRTSGNSRRCRRFKSMELWFATSATAWGGVGTILPKRNKRDKMAW